MPRAASGRDLRNRISIEQLKYDATADAAGQIDESDDDNWETALDAWAKIVPRASREFFGADQVRAEITHQITVRYSSQSLGITTRMRVVHGERLFHVASPPVDPDDRRAILRFDAIEVA